MEQIANPPRKIEVRINSDEVLTVIVRAMGFPNDHLLQVAGTIDREDSQVIKRAHLPRFNFGHVPLYVVEYHEFDNDKYSMCIDCQIFFSANNPSTR
jgi:hypothetical protein